MTIKEYLVDYASEDTKKIGDALILKEIENIPSETVRYLPSSCPSQSVPETVEATPQGISSQQQQQQHLQWSSCSRTFTERIIGSTTSTTAIGTFLPAQQSSGTAQ